MYLRSRNLLPQSISKLRLVATTVGEGLAKYDGFESGFIETLTPEHYLRLGCGYCGR